MVGNPWCDGVALCLVLALAALMIGGSAAAAIGLGLLLAVLFGVVLGLGLVAIKVWSDGTAMVGVPSLRPDEARLARSWQSPSGDAIGTPAPSGSRAPEDIVRERYARGELTPERYQEALVDRLKDRYVRGEIDIDDYEERLQHLLETPRTRVADGGRPPSPASVDTDRENGASQGLVGAHASKVAAEPGPRGVTDSRLIAGDSGG